MGLQRSSRGGGCGWRAVGAAPAAGTFVGAAEASAPHSAFRKSFHFIPFSVPASFAALYLALHSFIVRAYAVETCAANIAATNVPAQIVAERTSIKSSFTDVPQTTGIIARHDSRVHLIAPFSRTPFEASAIRDQALDGSCRHWVGRLRRWEGLRQTTPRFADPLGRPRITR